MREQQVGRPRTPSTPRFRARPPIPLNLFGIPFGLAGLAALWTTASSPLGVPHAVPDLLWIVAASAWVAVAARYLLGAPSVRADLRHPVFGPFAGLAPVVLTILGERVLASAPDIGRVWILATTSVSFAFAAWFLKHLLSGGLEITHLHSGYLLPTVAAGLISAQALSDAGFATLAMGAFGTGLLFWLLLGGVILYRIAFHPQTPAQLLPTLAIFSAPPAVAGNAWFVISGGGAPAGIDILQEVFFGLFLLLIALQLLLVPMYLRVPFALGFWAVTFTAVASGRYAVEFVELSDAPAAVPVQWAVTMLATFVVAVVAGASLRHAIRARRSRNMSPALTARR